MERSRFRPTARFILLFTFAGFLGGLAAAQPPTGKKVRDEEEETKPESKTPAKKIEEIVPEEKKNRRDLLEGKFDLLREASRATNPYLRGILTRLSIPFDELTSPNGGRTVKIVPFPQAVLPEGKFTFVELNADLRTGKERELLNGAGYIFRPYEEIVLDSVDQLLDPVLAKKLTGMTREEIEELGIQILQTTRRWHASQIEAKRRIGKEWSAVDDKLRKRIIALRRGQLKRAVDEKNWRRADDLALELGAFSDEPAVRRDVYRLVLRRALDNLRTDHDEDYNALRDALTQFETIGGGQGEDLAVAARRVLSTRAAQFAASAKRQADANQTAAAFNLLKCAEALDPEAAGIQELRTQLRARVLYVGVSQLPDRMTPATARTDAERAGVQLLFESLLQALPDPEIGRTFVPVLAESLPTLAPLARDFTLSKNARWSGNGNKNLDARDVMGTVELLQKSPYLPGAEGADLLNAERARIDDPRHLRLSFRQGLLEPLNLATFRVLPARFLKEEGKSADDDAFARKPFGSGPYRYEGREMEAPEREVAVFRTNPAYGQRAEKLGLPNIQEIRFVVPKPSTVAADFASGQLHLALDVPSVEIPRLRDDPAVAGQVKLLTPKTNRRIYMLAVNHRRLALQNVDLRRALSAAIDREAILNDIYRTGDAAASALVGPFPLKCWATPEKSRSASSMLFNQPLAAGLLAAAAPKALKLTLIYPAEDAQAVRACGKIKDQIESASRKTPNDPPQVEIALQQVSATQLHYRIDQEQDYELAYLHYDYRDDQFWLGDLFDREAAVRGGRNFLGYLAPGSNPQPDDVALATMLNDIRARRDFYGGVREETWKLHGKFLNRMPFIPLWQLDRHFAVHKSLTIRNENGPIGPDRIDPSAFFAGVEWWQLK